MAMQKTPYPERIYTVRRASAAVDLSADWDAPGWAAADALQLDCVFKESSSHHPRTRVRMLYDDAALYGMFLVEDRYVRAVARHDQDPVCQDSCVEFFVQPAGTDRYFNFEMNCGGTMLLYHITHCRSGNYEVIGAEELAQIQRFHTLPERVEPEMGEDCTWRLAFRIPLEFLVKHSGINPALSGQRWRGNFTKCADCCSHPHWISWQPLSKLDFHLPEEFGQLCFE